MRLVHFVHAGIQGVVLLLGISLRFVFTPPLIGATVSFCSVASLTGAAELGTSKRTYHLPRGDAATTLRQFATISGIPVLFMMDKVQGEQTNAVNGEYAPGDALKLMLAGTSLEIVKAANFEGLMVGRRPPSPPREMVVRDPIPQPQEKNMTPRSIPTKIRTWLAHAATAASAQQTPTNESPPPKDEILTLSDFVVTASKVSGYRAANSITATGIGTDIGSTPISISVITKDLIADTRSDLINDTLRFVPGVVTAPTNESQPAIRGFTGTYALRNGVFRRQNLTSWNVDRVEVIQGSSSIFYSNIRPGGVINYITAKPVIGETFADISVSAGDNGYYRAGGAFNVTLGDKLALRLVVGKLHDDTFRRAFTETQSFFSLGALWNITPNHQVTLEFGDEETWRSNSWTEYAAPLTNSRYWKNPTAIASGQTLAAFMSANYPALPRYDMWAPFTPRADDPYGRRTPILRNTYQHGTDRPIDLTYNAKLSDNLVFSAIGNYAYENNEGINPIWSGDIMADGSFVNFGAFLFVNVRDSFNLNTKLTYRTQLLGMKHTMMVGNDNQWVTQRFPQVGGSSTQNSPTFTFNPSTTGAPDGRFLVASSTAPFNSTRKNLQYFKGSYFVDQLSALNDTLFIVGGIRYVGFLQHVTYRADAGATVPAPPPDAVARKWTPQIGALYKLRDVALFASWSSSVIPQTQIDASGATVNPIDGKGWDVGAKLDLLGGALTGTIDYYQIRQDNVAISDTARNLANGLPAGATFGYYTYGNAQEVHGLQTDLNYNVTRSTQLVASWNHFLQAEFVAPQANAAQIGIPIAYQPKDMISVWTKFQAVEGSWKGLVLGGGVRHNAAAPTGGDPNTYKTLVPAFTVVDALVGYNTKIANRDVELRLNVKNAFDKIYRDGVGGFFNTSRRFIFSATTRF